MPLIPAEGRAYVPLMELVRQIQNCRLCAERFSGTATAHRPKPVVWFTPGARVLLVGQAPGMQVHRLGRPFADRSGDRLRDWMQTDEQVFYDRSKIAIVPMAFCFPGYDQRGSDLPPPPICAQTWREQVMQLLEPRLTLLIGGHAQRWHLGPAARSGVTATVADWRAYAPRIFPLPHPSWRNTGWLRRNPWFEADLLPALRVAILNALSEADDES